jgi:hypothetical protein
METHLVSGEIDTVSSHHVEGGVGDVYDSGYTEDKGKPNGEKGEYTPTDETTYNNVDNETHIFSLPQYIETTCPYDNLRGCKVRLPKAKK